MGLLERLLNPAVSRRIFQKELGLLARYVEAKHVWDHEAQAQGAT